ncbi:FkbM family methyltransferase [Zhongshania aquimaris]|uniref:FkbM family methyltransferase n=1 Tax=Zhongshania aquimaris TaxID=2857107 RepID=A0ABS6VN61_9GAMM|nr:FkbM family methyltransferase [Zhongshania aquimaris]MBW2939736.1 FkbM family methyltransferase [Zhongshania aquimaris]
MRIRFREFLKKFEFSRYVYRSIKRKSPEILDIKPKIIARYSKSNQRDFFVQIGVNDGDQQDPFQRVIEQNEWRGVMVEPVIYVFNRLIKNKDHLKHRVKFANVAISDQSGKADFWHLQEDAKLAEERRLYDALGSFRKEVVLSHKYLIPDIEERLIKTEVDTLTFDDFCELYDVKRIDVLQIDTEGYDYEIIKAINFDKVKPGLLIYEHLHLSDEDRRECRKIIQGHGYRYYEDTMDALCIKSSSIKKGRLGLLLSWYWLTTTRNIFGGIVG